MQRAARARERRSCTHHARLPDPARRAAPPSGAFGEVRAQGADALPRQRLHGRGAGSLRPPHPRAPGGERGPRLRGRAEARRARGHGDLPRRTAGAGGHARGRGRPGRTSPRTCAPSAPCRSACAGVRRVLLEARGEVFMPVAGFARMNEAARGARREGVRQPAQCRRREPAAAGSAHHRGAPAGAFFYGLGAVGGAAAARGRRDCSTLLRTLGLPVSPRCARCTASRAASATTPNRRAAHRACRTRSTASSTSRPPRRPGAPGVRVARAALGDRA